MKDLMMVKRLPASRSELQRCTSSRGVHVVTLPSREVSKKTHFIYEVKVDTRLLVPTTSFVP